MNILTNVEIRGLFRKLLLCILGYLSVSALFFWLMPDNALPGIFGASLCMVLIILLCCWRYFCRQEDTIEKASAQITKYLAGNLNARIECDEEGGIYKLFHKVNSLAAILNARAENEGRAKVFLKETISDISHQLKTPLAALNIYNGILQGEAEELPAIREFTELSEQELDRMENLVQNLLKITRLDAGTILLDMAPESVAEMMRDVEKHFAFRAQREGKSIVLSGDEDIILSCDYTWMREAIGNLVKNALDHTKQGALIGISWQSFSSVIQIKVEDNGSGIHPEDMYHIFKRFYRSRFSKDTQGIGLGLPLAKAVIEAHNGTVEVDSTLGKGTTFTINFLVQTMGEETNCT